MTDELTPQRELGLIRDALLQQFGPFPDLVTLAAQGLTTALWRNAGAEDVHGGQDSRIHDGEMFAANVATTRLIRSCLECVEYYETEDGWSDPEHMIDWETMTFELLAPERIVAGARSVADLLGPAYDEWAAGAANTIDYLADLEAERGRDYVLMRYACAANPAFWGGPSWPWTVETFVRYVQPEPPGITRAALWRALLEAPDRMDPEILSWCVSEGIQSANSIKRKNGGPGCLVGKPDRIARETGDAK